MLLGVPQRTPTPCRLKQERKMSTNVNNLIKGDTNWQSSNKSDFTGHNIKLAKFSNSSNILLVEKQRFLLPVNNNGPGFHHLLLKIPFSSTFSGSCCHLYGASLKFLEGVTFWTRRFPLHQTHHPALVWSLNQTPWSYFTAIPKSIIFTLAVSAGFFKRPLKKYQLEEVLTEVSKYAPTQTLSLSILHIYIYFILFYLYIYIKNIHSATAYLVVSCFLLETSR